MWQVQMPAFEAVSPIKAWKDNAPTLAEKLVISATKLMEIMLCDRLNA